MDQVTVGDISRIVAPAHFIVGADDPLDAGVAASGDGGQDAAVRRSACIADAGHLSNIENAEAFNRVALEWLLRQK